MSQFVSTAQFSILEADIWEMKKDVGRLTSKDEISNRINILNSDINTKLLERPTFNHIKKSLDVYDIKIASVEATLEETIEKLERTQQDQDNEIILLGQTIENCQKEAS